MGFFSRKKKRIVVLTAPISAGKTTVVKFLNKHKFRQYRFSDAIKIEIEKRGLDSDDPLNYHIVGDDMRKMGGADILSIKGIDALKGYQGRLVFDGARHPSEIEALRKAYGNEMIVVAVTSPYEDRYLRYSEKYKERGGLTTEQFSIIDNDELASNDELGHQVAKCIEMADVTITNDTDLEHFERQVDDFIEKIF